MSAGHHLSPVSGKNELRVEGECVCVCVCVFGSIFVNVESVAVRETSVEKT